MNRKELFEHHKELCATALGIMEKKNHDQFTDGDGSDASFCVEGSDYTSHARLALYKAIEARVWDVCMGTDLNCPLSSDEVVRTMRRIFDAGRVRNGRCFHFTTKGWLKYTPFLLAAHTLNYPLLCYLAKRPDTDTALCTASGNSALALAKRAISQLDQPEAERTNAHVVKFLEDLGLEDKDYVPEGAPRVL